MKKTKRRDNAHLRRGSISLGTFKDMDAQDKAYWAMQTPQARLRAMELMRRINYGKAAAGRLQRLLEIVQSKTHK